jgi:hypothetical protein
VVIYCDTSRLYLLSRLEFHELRLQQRSHWYSFHFYDGFEVFQHPVDTNNFRINARRFGCFCHYCHSSHFLLFVNLNDPELSPLLIECFLMKIRLVIFFKESSTTFLNCHCQFTLSNFKFHSTVYCIFEVRSQQNMMTENEFTANWLNGIHFFSYQVLPKFKR